MTKIILGEIKKKKNWKKKRNINKYHKNSFGTMNEMELSAGCNAKDRQKYAIGSWTTDWSYW